MRAQHWSARHLVLAAAAVAAGVWGTVPAQGASLSVSISKQAAPEDWIVLFEDDVEDVEGLARQEAKRHGAKLRDVYAGSVKGFTATFRGRRPGREATVWDARVRWIERDQRYTFAQTQVDATTGLDRIDQRNLPLSTTYDYTGTGAGVTAYVLDTGVMGTHTEFGTPSRVQAGYDATSSTSLRKILAGKKTAKPGNKDCHGHGTHVAGTIAGATYGVAKEATVVPIRVLSCSGSGSTSNIVKGIDWMIADFQRSGRPAVANMSLGGGKSVAMDDAVRTAISKGISFALAAGNSDADACGSSPSGVTEAMTIGAMNPVDDQRPAWSNWGPCLDWFAPGVAITSAGTRSTTSTAVFSGTSMAAPHTAGAAALYLQAHPGAQPSEVEAAIGEATTRDVVGGDVRATNRLLFTGSAPEPVPGP